MWAPAAPSQGLPRSPALVLGARAAIEARRKRSRREDPEVPRTDLRLRLTILAPRDRHTLTGLGVTVGYHRLFTHRSFKTTLAAGRARLDGGRGPASQTTPATRTAPTSTMLRDGAARCADSAMHNIPELMSREAKLDAHRLGERRDGARMVVKRRLVHGASAQSGRPVQVPVSNGQFRGSYGFVLRTVHVRVPKRLLRCPPHTTTAPRNWRARSAWSTRWDHRLPAEPGNPLASARPSENELRGRRSPARARHRSSKVRLRPPSLSVRTTSRSAGRDCSFSSGAIASPLGAGTSAQRRKP
jgi:hypothetical protein